VDTIDCAEGRIITSMLEEVVEPRIDIALNN
jgi:hypothetical protein